MTTHTLAGHSHGTTPPSRSVAITLASVDVGARDHAPLTSLPSATACD